MPPPTTRRGTGYIPDPYDPRDREFFTLGAGAAPDVDELDLSASAPPPRDQGMTNTCVGQSAATAIYTARRVMQMPVELPSVLWCYALARIDHQRPDRPLKDTGTYVRSCIKGLKRRGFPAEEHWPFDPWAPAHAMDMGDRVEVTRIEARPPLSAVRHAHDNRGPAGYYRITAYGDFLLDELDAALAGGLPFIAGMHVSQSFLENTDEFVERMDGPHAGGHAMAFIGRRRFNGARWYRCRNSWGVGWGDGGDAWLHESIMRQAFDIQVIDP